MISLRFDIQKPKERTTGCGGACSVSEAATEEEQVDSRNAIIDQGTS